MENMLIQKIYSKLESYFIFAQQPTIMKRVFTVKVTWPIPGIARSLPSKLSLPHASYFLGPYSWRPRTTRQPHFARKLLRSVDFALKTVRRTRQGQCDLLASQEQQTCLLNFFEPRRPQNFWSWSLEASFSQLLSDRRSHRLRISACFL